MYCHDREPCKTADSTDMPSFTLRGRKELRIRRMGANRLIRLNDPCSAAMRAVAIIAVIFLRNENESATVAFKCCQQTRRVSKHIDDETATVSALQNEVIYVAMQPTSSLTSQTTKRFRSVGE